MTAIATGSNPTSQPFGISSVLPLVRPPGGALRAGVLIPLSADARIASSRSRFSHLRGLEKALACHRADCGEVVTFSAPPRAPYHLEVARLFGLEKSIAAHKLDREHNK